MNKHLTLALFAATALAVPAAAQVPKLPTPTMLPRVSASLFPIARQTARIVAALQVFDGLSAGASHRDIAVALYGGNRVAAEWNGASDSMRSRVRRLAGLAHDLAAGGWQRMLL
jgi:hypothetical protein